jgi:hypothetical protein
MEQLNGTDGFAIEGRGQFDGRLAVRLPVLGDVMETVFST